MKEPEPIGEVVNVPNNVNHYDAAIDHLKRGMRHICYYLSCHSSSNHLTGALAHIVLAQYFIVELRNMHTADKTHSQHDEDELW